MKKGKKKRKKGRYDVSPLMLLSAIIVILIIFIGLGNYYDIFVRRPAPEYHVAPQGTMIATEFQNPFEGNGTTNGGGWIVNVTALSGPRTKWSKVIVTLKEPSWMPIDSFDGVKEENSDFYSTGSEVPLKWYLRKKGDPYFMDDSVRSSSLDNMREDGFKTLENASMLVVDKDSDGKLSVGDMVVVFRDHDGDGVDDIMDGANIGLEINHGKIGSALLIST